MSKFLIGQLVCDKKDGEIMEIVDFSKKTDRYITNWMGSLCLYSEEELVETQNYVDASEQETEDKLDLIIQKLNLLLETKK